MYCINGLQFISKSNIGVMLLDFYVNIPAQADDICLISTKNVDIQKNG